MRKLILLAALAIASPALAQNAISGSPRVQGTPDGYGDPLQVTIVGPNGADITASTAQKIQGNVDSGVADSGSPVKIGCKYVAAGETVTTGQRANCQASASGRQLVGIGGLYSGADGFTNTNSFVGLSADTDVATASRPGIGATLYYNGTTWDRTRGDTNGAVVLPGMSSTYWSYSNGASGILSNTTSAVTIKAAAGASIRNFIDSCTINSTAFGASVPLAIRDGAGGTVIWAVNVPTAGFLQPVNITFAMPLRGTANTLLEVVTTTANTSGTVWVSCQGHTGS